MRRTRPGRGSRSNLSSENGATSPSNEGPGAESGPRAPPHPPLLDIKGNSHSKRRNGSKSSHSESSATHFVFPPVSITRWEFQNRTADELETLAKKFRGKTRKSLIRKARAFRACGARTRVKACVDCGASRPGSGRQCSPGYPCSLRICPICNHTDSQRCVAELSPVVSRLIDASSLPEHKGYAFRSGTLTAKPRFRALPAKRLLMDLVGAKMRLPERHRRAEAIFG